MSIFRHRIILTVFLAVATFPAAFAQDGGWDWRQWSNEITRWPARQSQPDSISLFFIGDVMMHSAQIERPLGPFLEALGGRAKGADAAIANMEFTLAGAPYSGYPSFSAPDSMATYMASLGFDVFLCANNHILDKGYKGLKRTVALYSQLPGIQYTGVSLTEKDDSLRYPLILKIKGFRIALVNVTYGTNYYPGEHWPKVNHIRRNEMLQALDRARLAGCDYIIALPHWGEEYSLKHSPRQEETARWLAENGADLIIGTHPHVVQDSCTIVTSTGRKVPVFYSLGNAVSNMSATNTQLELALTVKLKKHLMGKASLEGIKAEFLWCTRPGALTNNYKTIPVSEYIGRRGEWLNPSDYDRMLRTLENVKKETKIYEAQDYD